MTEVAELNQIFEDSITSKMPILIFRIPGNEIETSREYLPEEILVRGWNQSTFGMGGSSSNEKLYFPKHTSQEEYAEAFSIYQKTFEASELRKAILSSVIVKERTSEFQPVDYFISLSEHYPDAFVYLLYHPSAGMWTGASPEVMLQGANGNYHTVALAGTQPVSETDNYHWGEKEIEEQELVSQHLRSILQEANAAQISEEGPYTARAGHVVHLKTDFNFEYEGKVDHLLELLHPTPAIAGLPVEAAKDLIQSSEKHQRGLYTGLIGVKKEGETSIYVNLRCMQISDEKLAIYVGGGLTDKSEERAEWEETRLKAKTLVNLLKS